MTFRDWAKDLYNMFNMDNQTAEEYWEAAFDEGVKWALKQNANTQNKIGLCSTQATHKHLANESVAEGHQKDWNEVD